MSSHNKRFLVTGGCGFLGANLSAAILQRDYQLSVIDNFFRSGSRQNLAWLESQGKFEFAEIDIRDMSVLEKHIRAYQPDVIFHLAGQVAMTTSIQSPLEDFQINALGGLHVLEAVRKHAPQAAIFYSSTNKVYGDLENIRLLEGDMRYLTPDYPKGFDESLPLDFRSPYGCSKGCMDQYMQDYHRIYGLKTVVFRHSSIFGGRQFPTIDQGWVGWFIQQALAIKRNPQRKPFTVSGNGKQVRDILFTEDLIDCYFSALDSIEQIQGEAFNIGGGIENSLSLLELFKILENDLSVTMPFETVDWRASDQKVFVSNNSKALSAFGWQPKLDRQQGINNMVDWLSSVNFDE